MKQTVLNHKISRKIIELDASNKALGRLATEIARILMGKHKANYTPHIDNGDLVVVSNVSKIKFSGKKLEQNKLYDHSGYPGGLKVRNLSEVFGRKPEYILSRAVSRMLPKNKLRPNMLKRLSFKK